MDPHRAIPFAVSVFALVANCAGPPDAQGAAGVRGPKGATALVGLDPEAPGANCTSGGVSVLIGVDEDGSGVLDGPEVDDTGFICAGIDGTSCTATETEVGLAIECPDGSQAALAIPGAEDFVAAMGPKANPNPLNHDRYTDAECLAAVEAAGYVAGPLFTAADAISSMGALSSDNPLNHTRYTDADAVAAVAAAGPAVGRWYATNDGAGQGFYQWGTELFSTGAAFTRSGDQRAIVVQRAGYYSVSVDVLQSDLGPGEFGYVKLQRNGIDISASYGNGVSAEAAIHKHSFTIIERFETGDEIAVKQDTPTATVYGRDDQFSSMSVAQIR